MADRTEFLESIRHRTRRGRYKPTKSPDSVWTPGVDRPEREEIEDPRQVYRGARGAGRARQTNRGSGRGTGVRSGSGAGGELLVRWDVEYLDELGADEPLRKPASRSLSARRPDLGEIAGRADIGLSTATWAIAETGSLVLEHGPGQGRSVTLLPPTYVAILPADRVLRTVPEAIQKYAGGTLPANVFSHRAEPFGRHRDVAGRRDARARRRARDPGR